MKALLNKQLTGQQSDFLEVYGHQYDHKLASSEWLSFLIRNISTRKCVAVSNTIPLPECLL